MTKNEIYNQVKSLEQKLSKVFYEIMDTKEISFYHNYAIDEKLLLITENLEKLLIEYELNNKIERLKLLIFATLSVLSTIVSFLFLITQNPSVLATLLFGIYASYRGMKACKQDTLIDTDLQKILKDMVIIATNCETFINKKMKIHEMRIVNELETKNEPIMDYYLANDILQSYFENDKLEMPNDTIKQIIVKMLQEDLNTEVNDINDLMMMAKEKINEEKLREELKLTRKNVEKGQN